MAEQTADAPDRLPEEETFENSIGMRFVRIERGTFQMGETAAPLPDEVVEGCPQRENGDFDEYPVHEVTISRPFFLGACQVTNAQYEQFDPEHRALRGKVGFSKDDDEAVVCVTWHDAVAFCEWLSEKEGLPYRLPTEAEWEYACRAGTQTPYHFGDDLSEAFRKNVQQSWYPDERRSEGETEIVPLTVGQTPPNAWGLCDMHGNVEEWCQDWYGPYEPGPQTDPIGRADGDFRVARGGSHSTYLYYLRSANRSGALPEDRSWVIGFRLALAAMPDAEPLPVPAPQPWQINVKQAIPPDITDGPDPGEPCFQGPRKYVHVPPDSQGPLYSRHNHDTGLAACANGDLLALWYTCVTEHGRELTVAASRLRYGEDEWEPAAPFWGAPDRNNHAPALWADPETGTLYHFNGMGAAATWGALAGIVRVSRDHGATWSKARITMPEHKNRQMPVQTVFRAQDGTILLPCDAVTGGQGGTATWLSTDDGQTWTDPGGTVAGIHAAVVQLEDGRLMGFGRGDDIDDRMPMSISSDMGKTWTYSPSSFPPITSGQRCVLLRLKEGPILFVSFAGPRNEPETAPMLITDASGKQRPVTGLFAAVSFDEGETWPNIRLVSDDGPGTEVETMDGNPFTMGFSSAEPGGYMSVCQGDNGLVHLISSRVHYAFNLAWLKTLPPSEPAKTERNHG